MNHVATAPAEMRAFFDAYVAAVNREEWDFVLGCFGFPMVWASAAQGTHISENVEQYRQSIPGNVARLKASGAIRVGVDSFTAYATGADTGLMVVDIARYRSDDSVYECKHVNYVTRRTPNGWKIVSIIDSQS